MAEGQPEVGQDKKKAIIALVLIIVVGISIYIVLRFGWGGFTAFFKRLMNWVIFFAIIGAIGFLIWKLLQKTPVDLVATTQQDIIDAGTFSKPPMLKDLYFTGDREHGEFKVGYITGYCQIQSYKDLRKISDLKPEQLKWLKDEAEKDGKVWNPSEYLLNEDCFIWKKMPWPLSMFEKPKVLRTLEDEHSQLVGDVKVYAVSLIRKFSYYWPNRAYLDIDRVDVSVIREAWRGHIHEYLKDAVAISRRSVGMDAAHQKAMEERRLLKLPTPLEQQERR